jgi:hypothetical protein
MKDCSWHKDNHQRRKRHHGTGKQPKIRKQLLLLGSKRFAALGRRFSFLPPQTALMLIDKDLLQPFLMPVRRALH